MLIQLADIVSGDFIHQLWHVLIIALCALVIFAIGMWFIQKLAPAYPVVLTVWIGFFVLVGGMIVLNFLMGLGGHPLYSW